MLRWLSVSLLLSWSVVARADDPKLIAVLPLSVPGNDVPANDRAALEEEIRNKAGDFLTPNGFVVLTGDNTLRVLSDNGIDAAKVCEANCSLDAARELKTQYFVSGSIGFVESTFVAFVRLYSAPDGKQIASMKVEADSMKAMLSTFSHKAPAFFTQIPGVTAPQPKDNGGQANSSQNLPLGDGPPGAWKAKFSPSWNERWVLVDSSAKPVCVLPCKKWLTPSSGYQLKFDAPTADQIITLNLPDNIGYIAGESVRIQPHTTRHGGVAAAVAGSILFAAGLIIGGVVGSQTADNVQFPGQPTSYDTLPGVLLGGLVGMVAGGVAAAIIFAVAERPAGIDITLDRSN